MDPWVPEIDNKAKDLTHLTSNGDNSDSPDKELFTNSLILCNTKSEFEDQFVIPTAQVFAFEKLPDSHLYLASLEKKLKVVQSVGEQKDTSRAILRSLEETRESSMVKLLTNSDANLGNRQLNNLDFDELKVNPILKKIAPEKQAVALEELVHLLKADQLSILLDEHNQENESTTATTVGITAQNDINKLNPDKVDSQSET